jgi:hypothetical protein
MLSMNITQPGVIRHRTRSLQVNDFRNLRYGKITPTDIDGALEFNGKLFIFIEAKFIGTPIGRGQELFLERITDSLTFKPQHFAYAIIADHHHPSDEDVDFSNMTVRTIRQNGRWKPPMQRGLTVRQAIDRMVSAVENITGKPLYTKD